MNSLNGVDVESSGYKAVLTVVEFDLLGLLGTTTTAQQVRKPLGQRSVYRVCSSSKYAAVRTTAGCSAKASELSNLA